MTCDLDWQEEVVLQEENDVLDWYCGSATPFIFFNDGIIFKRNGEDRTHCRLLTSLKNIIKYDGDFYNKLNKSKRIQSFNISDKSYQEIKKFFIKYRTEYGCYADDLGVFIRDIPKNVWGRCWTSNNVIAFWNTKGKIKPMHINLLLNAFNLDVNKTKIFCKNVKEVPANKFLQSKINSKNVKKVDELITKLHTISCSKLVPEGFGSRMNKGNMPIEQYRQLRYSDYI